MCFSPSVQCGPICLGLCITVPNSQTKAINIIYLDLLSLTRMHRLIGPFSFLPKLPVLEKSTFS